MTDSGRNSDRGLLQSDRVCIPHTSSGQLLQAALVVCDNNDQSAVPAILQALGLLPSQAGTVDEVGRLQAGCVHGTRAAVREHRYRADRLCGPCRRWVDADERIRAFREGRYPRPAPCYERCGTNAGALRHYRRGERLCAACRAAKNTYQRARRACLKTWRCERAL